MEEILASIRRIIADDDRVKPQAKAPEPVMVQPSPVASPPPPRPAPAPPRVAAPPPPPPETVKPDEIDAVMAIPEPPLEPASDILDLTEQMAAPAPAPEGFRTIDGQSDLVFEEAPPPPPAPEPPPRSMATELSDRALVSSATSAAVDSAFNTLAQTVLVQNARTLEDLVREMLRPMLKTWLDDNLPGLVERLVRAEIERVSRGRS
jgi:cell pole-organizing protein PopZ